MFPLSTIWGYRCSLYLRYGGIDVASFYDMGVSMLPVSMIILFDFRIVPTMCYFLFFISLYIILPFLNFICD
jgi:hypothetical protein